MPWSRLENYWMRLTNDTGASEINISCVIDEKEANRALNVVHTNLFTFLD